MRLTGLLLAAALPLAAADAFVPVAVWYGGGKARAPMLESNPRGKRDIWKKDLEQIRALGFNAIRCWVDWASAEPREGEFRLDTLEVLLSLAEETGLRVFVQVYADSAPSWLGRKYPDALFVSSNGMAIRPETAPGYCRDHPGIRDADLRFYRALAERARRSPAFAGWDLWSEPHVINWATPTYIDRPEFCFCAHTQRRFRGWLERKYGTLERLNEAWYRQYESWDEVEPNRLSTILSYSDYLDWKLFLAGKLAEDLRGRYEAVKALTPALPATSHAASVGLFSSPHWWEGQSDDWEMARQVDYYGTSFYPKHSAGVDRDPLFRGALLDFARSFGYADGRGGFYIGEMQAGFGTIALNVSSEVTPADLRVWAWSALSRGARAINLYAWYPMSTGYESGGFGLIELDGTVTERARVAGAIARTVSAHAELFARARPPKAEVAILYNPLVHFVGGRQRQAAYGAPQGEVAGIERDSWLGPYRALFPSNVPVDFVHIRDLGALPQYKLALLPYPLMLPAASAAALKDYVRNGGHLYAEARAGWNDERGRASAIIPGLGLDELFGCREAAVESANQVTVEWNGARLPGRWYREALTPQSAGARAVARFDSGAVAMVEHRYGRGQTLFAGTYLSASYVPRPEPALRAFFEHLLEWAGVARPIVSSAEARFLETGGERLLFLFNHASQPVRARVEMSGGWRAADLLTGQPREWGEVALEAQGVAVWRLSR